ncbi:phage virion morphogenesis protein [Vibrio cincinnatiensis]|uniref:phage virion morphogenesis protein n=1 Tax=unclassified Vibrio TaxID=2614977 RepID=UPI001372D3F0|nr:MULTISPECIES: phage virion morphogenesis protein [unclassified Vibrio]NAX01440.1 phage virion morphogenesis protein [Vibrio sp. V34_P3A8T189]NAX07205.1 phage virion morphogenesis protein [Vibrio sp. V40_P2S30T141]
MSIAVQVTGTEQLERFQKMLDALSNPALKQELLDSLGAVVESQTRRRIADEKSAPDGTNWESWSDSYAKTRNGNQSLLQGEGDLLDSIQYVVEKDQVRVGSPLAYAGVHQNGFSGAVQVDAHTRLITQAFGKALKFPVYQSVSSFTRMMDVPQREFLGLSRDNQTEVYAVIGDFWSEVLQ